MNYYNEFDPFAANWLRSLIKKGLIPNGHVDTRDIRDVLPSELAGYTQCHFFAGIGGWSYALQLAGWPADRPVWTGSCPCQPFSAAGKGAGFADERHLWPALFHLVRELRPIEFFGEQVDKALAWFDLVQNDLEGINYAVGAAVIPAASVGAQHIRQRLWFVANSNKARWKNLERIAAAEAQADFRTPPSVVPRKEIEHFRGAIKPDSRWVVDGLSGEGLAVSAYGNAIVPQVAAEFIAAYMETTCTQD